MKRLKRNLSWVAGALTVLALTATLLASGALAGSAPANRGGGDDGSTMTPIQHLVVIFQENVSFDHYFATYPNAANPSGEPKFTALPGTPTVNGLTGVLLTNNPNSANPFRLDRSQAVTCDQDHNYKDEQEAYNAGLVNQFVQNLSCSGNEVMGYYDGNTVTALWNYAQYFALNDNSFGTTFGPSTPGALNLISGQTHGAAITNGLSATGNVSNSSVIGDPDPALDDCSNPKRTQIEMSSTNKNIGDLLNAANVTWGWFQGGFAPTTPAVIGVSPAVCGASHTGLAGMSADYSPHHEPFQYYASTANPHHLPPSSIPMIGHTDQANHQYDLTNFWQAADHNSLPAVSFLKAAEFQDGHAGYSDPLDEQTFLVNTINHLESLPSWKNTAVVISYDDSDGWYDHVMAPIINGSNDSAYDRLNGTTCGGATSLGTYEDRCGYGPRLPLMVISPWAKTNFVDNTLTDQSSILRFIEDNWKTGQIGDSSFDAVAGSLLNMFDFKHGLRDINMRLDPSTGEIVDRH
jgi:phospholipase C